jgi:hypothetical protein
MCALTAQINQILSDGERVDALWCERAKVRDRADCEKNYCFW